MRPVQLIAEVATNHGGSMELAERFIREYADAGADWIKFQHTRVRHLRPEDPQYEWFRRVEFSLGEWRILKDTCDAYHLKFLTTVYHADDVAEVAALGVERIKIGSGESADAPLARAVRAAGIPVFVSDGLGLLPQDWPVLWGPSAIVFQCVSRYPHPAACAQRSFLRYHGYSDHSIGLEGCAIAICEGAQVIEKHVSLPCQARRIQPWEASLEEFRALRVLADEDPHRFIGRWQYA